jgi:asparagine synthase (glutamine-hydrolysing)
MEEPRLGQSYPNFYAAKLASHFVKVVLAGTGGDELFGGYPWRYYRAADSTDFSSYIDSYYQFWHRLLPVNEIDQLFQPIWPRVRHVSTRDIFRDSFNNQGRALTCPEDYVNHSLYLEAKTFLHGLLVVDDKLSMARGLEGRLPFLDNDLVDFAMRLPPRFKLRRLEKVVPFDENNPSPKLLQYNTLTYDGKMILRKAMARYIPPVIVEATKQGFTGPDASWFRGDSIAFVRRTLIDREPLLCAFLDRDVVHRLVADHMDGRENRRLLIWSLLCFETWLQTFVEGSHWTAANH